jgi:ABC-type uncharacterized transport system YnjBCD permease subunit
MHLLKALLGFIVGAIMGAVVAVILAGIWFFVIYPQFHRVNWDNPGIGAMPLVAAPFGAIIGAALGAVLAARWR